MTRSYPSYLDDRDVLSTTETCRVLGIGRTTLYRYTKAGMIRRIIRSDGRKGYTGRDIKGMFAVRPDK